MKVVESYPCGVICAGVYVVSWGTGGEDMYDMVKAKARYVTGTISLKQLAVETGIPVSALRKECKVRSWVAERAEYHKRVISDAIEAAHDERVDYLAGVMRSSMALSDVIVGAYEDKQQFYRHLVSVSDGQKSDVEERVYNKLDTRAIRDLAAAQKDLAVTIRNVFRLPTQAEEHAQNIAAERLALDKRKAEADAGVDNTIKVELVGADLEDYAR